MASPSLCVTVDLDAIRCYTAIHDLPDDPFAPVSQDPIFAYGMDRFLALFDELNIRATFFCVGQDLEDPANAAAIRRAYDAGHELANHTHTHLYNLRSQSLTTIRDEIERTEHALIELTGQGPVGFRTPGYNLSPAIAQELHTRGYLYDSSLFPCPPYYTAKAAVMAWMRARGQSSRSQMTLPRTLLCPLTPYRCDPTQPWTHAAPEAPSLWQVPMCVVPYARFPIIGTSLHLLGKRGFQAVLPSLLRTSPDILHLEFHGIDLVDQRDEGVPFALIPKQRDLRVSIRDKIQLYRAVFQAAIQQGLTPRTLQRTVHLFQEHSPSR